MRQVTKKGLLTVAAFGGAFALSGGAAFADSDADGVAANSPGVASGNNVQVPVDVPVNICGNTVNVVGVLNPAFGNNCTSGGGDHGHGGDHGDGGADADGVAADSPGVASGNNVQVPVDVPVNACGNTIDVVGVLNPAFGNDCGSGGEHRPEEPGNPEEPESPEEPGNPEEPESPEEPNSPEEPESPEEPNSPEKPNGPVEPEGPAPAGDSGPEAEPVASTPEGELAETGSGVPMTAAVSMGAGLVLGGALLYRRSRVASRG
ncbi:chaplin [Streptomyces sp. RFCAC02]|uniref:chaplin n=1 Tax=Streptomyces sp. RFCAC02 TaxID=2499143 RepID=UPI001020649C|nr:chaplin [Streptomyces sp. RFCAC02]